MKKKRREGEHSEVDTVPISTRRRRGFAEPERSLEKKTEKRKRCARANARTRTHQRPPRGVNTRIKRVFMLFARNIAYSFPLRPSTTPLRSAEICRPTGRAWLLKRKKCLGFARRERRRERFFGVDDRSSRGIRIISRELDRRSIERDVKGKRERERDVPIVYRFWTACFLCRTFFTFGLILGGSGPFFPFFSPSPSPCLWSPAQQKIRERERVTCIVTVYFAKFARRVSKYYRCTTKTKSLSASRVFVLFFFFFFSIFHLLFLLLLLLRSCAPLLSLPRRFLAPAGATRRPLPLLLVVAAASCSNLRGGR